MFALVDGNNFYASCQQLFETELRGKPLVVLSNNDGCAIARSAERRSPKNRTPAEATPEQLAAFEARRR